VTGTTTGKSWGRVPPLSEAPRPTTTASMRHVRELFEPRLVHEVMERPVMRNRADSKRVGALAVGRSARSPPAGAPAVVRYRPRRLIVGRSRGESRATSAGSGWCPFPAELGAEVGLTPTTCADAPPPKSLTTTTRIEQHDQQPQPTCHLDPRSGRSRDEGGSAWLSDLSRSGMARCAPCEADRSGLRGRQARVVGLVP